MTIIISYDLEQIHSLFKVKMEKLGYQDRFYSGDRIVHLLHTTLIHFDKSVTTAVNDAKVVDSMVGSNLL